MAATVAFALSGVMMAARKRFDAVGVRGGVCVGLRGGTLRDLLLDQRPFSGCSTPNLSGAFWAQPGRHAVHAPAALSTHRARHAAARRHRPGAVAAVGVDIATAVGMPALIAVMMGVTTGVFGGVLRDVL